MSNAGEDYVNRLFDRMDHWRHFPNYQLERRADLFFSMYLPEILTARLGFSVDEILIPEFPIRKGSIYGETVVGANQSVKADYLAFSRDRKRAILVELKTDMNSRNTLQDQYLQQASSKPFGELLEGLLKIFMQTNARRKYFALMQALGDLGQLDVSQGWKELMGRSNHQGLSKMADARPIKICSQVEKENTWVVYVEPSEDDMKSEAHDRTIHITFEQTAKIIERNGDPFSLRFAQSLREWGSRAAGNTCLLCPQ